MKVGIDLHVVDGKYQGSRTHAIELFSRVVARHPDIEFFLFADDIEHLAESSPSFRAPNVSLVRMKAANPLVRLMHQLPSLEASCGLDILHTQYISPPLGKALQMVTIHDILFESHPEYFGLLFRCRSKVLVRLSAKRASHVFTVSKFSRDEIVHRYGIPASRISVISNAADTARFYPTHTMALEQLGRGLSRGQYILTVGRLEPRKNHVTLLRAYARLGRDAPRLVIVGQRDFRYAGALDLIEKLQLGDRVVLIENATDAELPVLYRNAALFVYPALAEGFGMPPLEAMASGVPCIVSDSTALTEVVAEAGLLVAPGDESALHRAIVQLLGDESLRKRYVAKGQGRVRNFSWDSSADIVAASYRMACSNVRRYAH